MDNYIKELHGIDREIQKITGSVTFISVLGKVAEIALIKYQ